MFEDGVVTPHSRTKGNSNYIWADILQNIEKSKLLQNVITFDESWFFQYDPQCNRQSMYWKTPVHQGKRNYGRENPNLKQWWPFSTSIRWIVQVDWVPEVQTVNQVYYKEGLAYLRQRVRRRRSEMWKKASWVCKSDVWLTVHRNSVWIRKTN